MDPALGAFGLAFLALILSTIHQHRERAASRTLAEEQRAALGQLAEEVALLREGLVHGGAVKPPAIPPPPLLPAGADPLAGVPLERPTPSATRTAEAFRQRTTRRSGTTGDEPEKGSG
jgi:hypothetical protein